MRSFARLDFRRVVRTLARVRRENADRDVVGRVSMKSIKARREFWTTDSEARPAEPMMPRMMAEWMAGEGEVSRIWRAERKYVYDETPSGMSLTALK